MPNRMQRPGASEGKESALQRKHRNYLRGKLHKTDAEVRKNSASKLKTAAFKTKKEKKAYKFVYVIETD